MMVKFIHPIVVSEIAGDALVALFFEQAVEYYRALAVGVVGDVAVVEFGDQVNGAMPFGNFLVVAGRDVAEVVLNFTSPQTRNVASAQLRKGKRFKVAVFHFNWQQLHHGVVKAAGKTRPRIYAEVAQFGGIVGFAFKKIHGTDPLAIGDQAQIGKYIVNVIGHAAFD